MPCGELPQISGAPWIYTWASPGPVTVSSGIENTLADDGTQITCVHPTAHPLGLEISSPSSNITPTPMPPPQGIGEIILPKEAVAQTAIATWGQMTSQTSHPNQIIQKCRCNPCLYPDSIKSHSSARVDLLNR
ncbi:uncharacterized protein BO80DRAFT_30905 [Aspergillus ibericus CBS 121593]|uniref:Uncharacterized protein n=1 Tax=Aspergillus ibericus CBS 121593 TaxID=1448316 RepID=A0A395H5B9_9EURO|nr:hypothetical protein BO80DRAFT_30905 [Aspergillus ibericus CBS 121593]RAL02783.1 hypothetical protein BO80DRAFT_30905 [Aspergillus ibericus CBS 121593]